MSNEENLEKVVGQGEPDQAQAPASEPEQSVSESEAESPVSESQEETTASEPVPDKQPEPVKKAKPAKAKMDPEKKLKLFKLIYYPALCVFIALMFIFSALDGVCGYSPSARDDAYYTAVNKHIKSLEGVRSVMATGNAAAAGIDSAREYIVDTLAAGGFNKVDEDKPDSEKADEKVVTKTGWFVAPAGTPEPTVTLHTSVPSAELMKRSGEGYLAGVTLTNIVAGIPSLKQKPGAVVITVRYDTRTDTAGAADNAAFVANALQTLVGYAKAGKTFDNDLIVVFTEDVDGAYGAYSFFDTFKGFNGAVSRARYGISLEAYGNSGTLALTDASGAGLDYINAVSAIADNALCVSVLPDTIPAALKRADSVAAFGSVPALQIAVVGGMDAAQSSLDTAANISQSVVKQEARLLKDYIEKFACSNQKYSAKGSDKTVFFSYLDGGTVAYSAVASYVVGALIIAAIAAAIALTAIKKTFSLRNMLLALGMELLVIVSTLVAMYAAYFLTTLMLTGFGVFPIRAITEIRYLNAGILIAAMLVSLAASFGFTTLYKKLFRVTSSESVRGVALMFGLVGAIMSFACPAYSYLTSWLGLLLVGVLIASVCLHKPFKNKFGIGMDRLYLYAIPVAFCLPLIMPSVTSIMTMLPLVLLPVVMTLFTGLIGVGVPYLDRSRAALDRLVKKLPMRTIRVEHTVTEKVEDRAKKGKFTEKTYRRVDKEKVPFNYKNYFGISVVAVLAIVIALFSGGFGFDFDKTVTGYYSYDDAVYNDAIVYEWEKDASGKISQKMVVSDLNAYKYLRTSLEFKWDSENARYYRNVSTASERVVDRQPSYSKDTVDTDDDKKKKDVYTVTTFEGSISRVTVTIPSAKSITKITVKEKSKADIPEYNGYVYEFEREDEITLRLPAGFGDFTLEFEGGAASKIEYEEQLNISAAESSTANLDNLDDWNRVTSDFRKTTVGKALRGGIVLKTVLTA